MKEGGALYSVFFFAFYFRTFHFPTWSSIRGNRPPGSAKYTRQKSSSPLTLGLRGKIAAESCFGADAGVQCSLVSE